MFLAMCAAALSLQVFKPHAPVQDWPGTQSGWTPAPLQCLHTQITSSVSFMFKSRIEPFMNCSLESQCICCNPLEAWDCRSKTKRVLGASCLPIISLDLVGLQKNYKFQNTMHRCRMAKSNLIMLMLPRIDLQQMMMQADAQPLTLLQAFSNSVKHLTVLVSNCETQRQSPRVMLRASMTLHSSKAPQYLYCTRRSPSSKLTLPSEEYSCATGASAA